MWFAEKIVEEDHEGENGNNLEEEKKMILNAEMKINPLKSPFRPRPSELRVDPTYSKVRQSNVLSFYRFLFLFDLTYS